MKNKAVIITGIESLIAYYTFRSKQAGQVALAAKRKHETAGPGSWHLDIWLRYRAEAFNFGRTAKELGKLLK